MKQSILLDKDYLTKLIDKAITPKYKLKYSIVNSSTTNSAYIRFKVRKGVEIHIRISDHYDKNKNMKQFIIRMNSKLTKSRIDLLIRTITNSIKFGARINLYKLLSKGDVNAK